MTIQSYSNLIYDNKTNSYMVSSPAVSDIASASDKESSSDKTDTISSLSKKRDEINSAKKDLINKTLAEGKTLSSIDTNLKEYKNQLLEINENISKIYEKQYSNLQSHQSIYDSNEFNPLSALTTTPQAYKIISSMQSKLQGRANVLKSQMQTDSLRSTSYNNNSSKKEEMEKLTAKSQVLSNALESYKKQQAEIAEAGLNYENYTIPNSNQQQTAFIMNA